MIGLVKDYPSDYWTCMDRYCVIFIGSFYYNMLEAVSGDSDYCHAAKAESRIKVYARQNKIIAQLVIGIVNGKLSNI